MALSELIEAMRQQEEEEKLLLDIVKLSDRETAVAAANIYSKRVDSFDGYLCQLSKLKNILEAGIPQSIALKAADGCADVEKMIQYYQGERNVKKINNKQRTI